jgi:hypothetical protein
MLMESKTTYCFGWLLTVAALAQSPVTLAIDTQAPSWSIPEDFSGLSFESWVEGSDRGGISGRLFSPTIGPGQQGGRYVWTRKVRAKTVTVALYQEQYLRLKQAVTNQRKLERIVKQMQILSRHILFENVLSAFRHKRLIKKIIGLN